MVGSWRPLHEHHAIDAVAWAVTFADHIPDLLLKKLASETQGRAEERGLIIASSAPAGFHIRVGAAGFELPDAAASAGRTFSSPPEPGDISGRGFTEQFVLGPNSLILRTNKYVSWKYHLERVEELLGPLLEVLRSVVGIATTKVEYLDRFWFDGPNSELAIDDLLRRDSPYLAPFIFDAEDIWHVHTGLFLPGETARKNLLQLRIDALYHQLGEESDPQPTIAVNLRSIREDRFAEDDPEQGLFGTESLLVNMSGMHQELKQVLGTLVSPDMARRIHLTEQL